jgi:hypothetical protein
MSISKSALALILACSLSAATRDSFTLELRIQGSRGTAAVLGVSDLHARPTLTVKSGDNLKVHWAVTNNGTARVPDITLHFFLDGASPANSAVSSKPGSSAAYESALLMDFDPARTGSGELLLQAPGPGTYLAELETIGAASKAGQAYFVALNINVQ